MTTETKQGSEAASRDDEEQSVLPTVLAGAGILAVAALLIFWPSDDEAKAGAGGAKDKAGQVADGGGANAAAARAAGVGAREVDAPTTPNSRHRNPAIKLPPNVGMSPGMPEPAPKDPPADATTDEKIAFYEKRLEQAIRVRENRQKFKERLPSVRERIENGPNAAQQLETFEQRKKIVEDNYDKAVAEVEDIERKLAELR